MKHCNLIVHLSPSANEPSPCRGGGGACEGNTSPQGHWRGMMGLFNHASESQRVVKNNVRSPNVYGRNFGDKYLQIWHSAIQHLRAGLLFSGQVSPAQLTQNILTMLPPCSGNVITLTKHFSNIVRTFCVGWDVTSCLFLHLLCYLHSDTFKNIF